MAVIDAKQVTTADELIRLPTGMGRRYELVRGELKTMTPAGSRHGRIAFRLGLKLGAHVLQNGLGEVFAAETGFLLRRDPDTVRAPDVAFVSAGRLPEGGLPRGFFPGAPDLAVEVVSPDDAADEVQQKVLDYLRAGARQVWVVYPDTRSVMVHAAGGEARTLGPEETLDGGEVAPGFAVRVGEFFE